MLLPEAFKGCRLCPELVGCSTRVVGGEFANPELAGKAPLLMMIGRNPGQNEDTQGRPFIGRAGKLLRNITQQYIDSKLAVIYYTNLVKHFSPKNRPPTQTEINNCRQWLEAEVRILRPHGMMWFGREAQEAAGFGKEERHYYRTMDFVSSVSRVGSVNRVVCSNTFHPSYAARGNKEAERKIAEDIAQLYIMSRTVWNNQKSC